MFRLVLLGIAGSGTGVEESVVRVAAGLAARNEAGFAVLHVRAPLSREGGCVLHLPTEAYLEARRAEVEEVCRKAMPPGLTADVMLESGFMHVELLKTARLMSPDLIVLGGLNDVERCRRELSDSSEDAAQIVACSAPCPMIIVPTEVPELCGPFRRILAVTDLSRDAWSFLGLVGRVAESEQAAVRVFHPVPLQDGTILPEPAVLTRQIEKASELLGGLCRGLSLNAETGVREGNPAMEILKDAREYGADLLILPANVFSTHAGCAASIVGRVLAGVRCAVLLVGPQVLAAQTKSTCGVTQENVR